MSCDYSISRWPDEKEVYEKMTNLVNDKIYRIRPEAMKEYLNYFESKCTKSKSMIEEAKQYIPGGVQHNLAFNYPFPLVITKAEGPYLYDIDGNRYVDYLQAGGPTLLGSNYKLNYHQWGEDLPLLSIYKYNPRQNPDLLMKILLSKQSRYLAVYCIQS